MEKTFVTKIPAGDIVEIRKLSDGTLEVVQRMPTETINKEAKFISKEVAPCSEIIISDDTFVLIEASKLSLDDDFMKFNPRKDEIKVFKNGLCKVIEKGVKDFYRPVIDPSFTQDQEGVYFQTGKKSAVGKSYTWWEKVAKEFNSKRGSRLGTKSEYIAFLGVLIKTMVSNGWSKAEAWNAVCVDSKILGHYRNSKDAKYQFEPTGSRGICGFYDLASTCKILAKDVKGEDFWLASGCYGNLSYICPIADLYLYHIYDFCGTTSVGWIVLET